jgi:hypothetical protein
MNDSDKMRAEFEAWATPYELDLRRLTEGYLSSASNNCWTIWRAAYAAGQGAEREAIVQTIRTVRGSLAWQSKISFAALAELIENKSENEQ